ncbi:MAG: hypothetical protein HN921_18525 [Bacteroidetes bacterium]|jgi:hypothetical protein|nr:hypothetical protein [Candidatus Woesearchaeota archaeon]MBT5990360.1 hypothetical protein [Bacteroidota bacterium]MBT7041829.1 hypothetical protein [Bacteroidota bacterium]MBT7996943.1 hypothetical protein [Bacteroidota bacterium]
MIQYNENQLRIIELSAKDIKTNDEANVLNSAVLTEIDNILNNHGEYFQVAKGIKKGRKFKSGKCYSVAAIQMGKGFDYVEGYVRVKNNERKVAHAWNRDSEGNHIDFGVNNPEDCEYFGIVIPVKKVYHIGYKNGGIWYAVLPFLDINEI